MNDLKTYKDSKELPFFIYKRIMQTGDFLYMIKGYDSDKDYDADPKEMEDKFNDLIQDFVLTVNASSEEISDHANYLISTLEFNKLSVIHQVIENLLKCKNALQKLTDQDQDEEINEIVSQLMEGVKIQRSADLNIQLQKLRDKISVHESNIEKYKELIEKENPNSDADQDLDKQFINVCLGLEIPFPDESKISLYQFSIMVDKVIEKSKSLEKINNK